MFTPWEEGRAMNEMEDGSLLLAGGTSDSLWAKTYQTGGEGHSAAYSLQLTPDGGALLAGITEADIFLLKTNSNGDSLWLRGFDYSEADWGSTHQLLNDGGQLIGGSTRVGEEQVRSPLQLEQLELPSGIYFFSIENPTTSPINGKFIVKKRD